jgi:uncharacterized membrane protein
MFLTGGKESRTLLIIWLVTRVRNTRKLPSKNGLSDTTTSLANFWCRSQDNRAYVISALIEKIIACLQRNSNDFAAKIALISHCAVILSQTKKG